MLPFLLLTEEQREGFKSVLLLFLGCILLVHLIKIFLIAYRNYIENELKESAERQNRSSEPERASPPPQEPSARPVYYLFEKKRSTKKRREDYAPPRKIHFDEEP